MTLEVWEPDGFRLTAFPSPDSELGDFGWWASLVGEDPEQVIARPRTGTWQNEGPFASGTLLLVAQPARIDWRYFVRQEQDPEKEHIFTLGSFSGALNRFLPLMYKWLQLESSPSMIRLAFGVSLLQPVGSVEEAYRRLSSFLPFTIDAEHVSDFRYQINRWRESGTGVRGLHINRLSKWAALSLRQAVLRIGMSEELVRKAYGDEFNAVHVELDINTAPDFEGELPRDKLATILEELVDFAKEIASEGDIR